MSLAEKVKNPPVRKFPCAVAKLLRDLPDAEAAALDEMGAQALAGTRSWLSIQTDVTGELQRDEALAKLGLTCPGVQRFVRHYRDRDCACHRGHGSS